MKDSNFAILRSIFVVGLALFAMFFGSGNLIFPLEVGKYTQIGFMASLAGFCLTAVLLPFLGVMVMIVLEGDYQSLFRIFGETLSRWIPFILLVCWIPLGSGPRCITLSHASLGHLVPEFSLVLYCVLYSVVVYIVAYSKSRMLDILGYVLTPLLLFSIGVVFFSYDLQMPTMGDWNLSDFWLGVKEGYQTMDMVASIFFAASIIKVISQSRDRFFQRAFGSFSLGILLLFVVYSSLLLLAYQQQAILGSVPKERLLVHLIDSMPTHSLAWLPIVVINLACLTTSVALTVVFAEDLKQRFPKSFLHRYSLEFSTLVLGGLATFGFQKISSISEPIFQVLYPILIVVICIALSRSAIQRLKRPVK